MKITVTYVLISLCIVLASVPITEGRNKVKEKELAKLCRQQGLPLPIGLRAAVLDRVRARERTMLTWGVGGIALGGLASVFVPVVPGSDARGLVVILLAVLGMTIGSYRGALKGSGRINAHGPRVAQSRLRSVADYSTKEERLAARLVPAVIGLAFLTALVVWLLIPVRPPGGTLRPVLIAVVAAAALVMSVLLGAARTRVVNWPQHASNDLELAWDDALRAASIRHLQDGAISAGLLGTLCVLFEAATWLIPLEVRDASFVLTMSLGYFAFGVGVVCWVLLIVPWAVGRTQKNPSQGMWSDAPFRAV